MVGSLSNDVDFLAGCKIQDAKYKIQDAKYKIQDARYRIPDAHLESCILYPASCRPSCIFMLTGFISQSFNCYIRHQADACNKRIFINIKCWCMKSVGDSFTFVTHTQQIKTGI